MSKQKFEYDVLFLSQHGPLTTQLNEKAKLGWRVVGVAPSGSGQYFQVIVERPLNSNA